MGNYIIDWSAIAAFLAAAAALYGVWRGNRTAQTNLSAQLDLERIKFRESWIQNLRGKMSIVGGMLAHVKALNPEQVVELSKALVEMLLLMNPNDSDYETLRKMTKKLKQKAGGEELASENEKDESFVYSDYTRICQKILKREWDRLNQEIDSHKSINRKQKKKKC